MRNEVTYARDTSVSLPRSSPYFRIFKSTNKDDNANGGDKKRRLLTPVEFGENLKVILGKRSRRTKISIEEFKDAVDQYLAK